MQCCHRRSPRWCETNNLGGSLTPLEVFTAALLARMRQWGHEATEYRGTPSAYVTMYATTSDGSRLSLARRVIFSPASNRDFSSESFSAVTGTL